MGLPNPELPLKPLIIVTAEGGGIHSAAWTAAVLMELEKQFYIQNPANTFHANLVLASTVSGGSVGLLPFLREYTSDGKFSNIDATANRVTIAASCSSLAAVAWGLSYYDALHFFLPLPWHSDGATWSNGVPGGWDRSWALERAFARNLDDDSCRLTGSPGEKIARVPIRTGYELTLGNYPVTSDRPAFTFNTTAVETGGRFLLGQLSASKRDGVRRRSSGGIVLARLCLFRSCPRPEGERRTAICRFAAGDGRTLAGYFPYISSASRIPEKFAPLGYHFVDGGYFDNDGTSSVVEFLHYALTMQCQQKETVKSLTAACQKPCPPQQQMGDKPSLNPDAWPYGEQKAPILLIEIRDGPGPRCKE